MTRLVPGRHLARVSLDNLSGWAMKNRTTSNVHPDDYFGADFRLAPGGVPLAGRFLWP